jgi:protein tyrosine phosphatase (PTP) superfamily phosphohydrolase (DUF442 family)
MAGTELGQVYHYLPVTERLGTAGQPKEGQFKAIRDAGYEVVINLDKPGPSHPIQNEGELVHAHGMTYVHIPVVWTEPTLEDLKAFFDAMDEHGDERVFVHCAANMRVSAFVFLYRVICQGVPVPEARQALDALWEPNAVWKAFIQDALVHYGVEASLWESPPS